MPAEFVFADENDTTVKFDVEVDGSGNLVLRSNGQSIIAFDKLSGHAQRLGTNAACGLPLDGDNKVFVS